MKIRILLTVLITVLSFEIFNLYAQEKRKVTSPSKTLYLYPKGQNGGVALEGCFVPTESNGITEKEQKNKYGGISKVGDRARFDLYFPEKPNGQMVIVCPGGGYTIVSAANEGSYVADWLVKKGITVAVVIYRIPEGHWNVPLFDVQNVFKYCRSHSKEWGVNKIGVMGFSAGGHLAASASNMFTDAETRPDFSILFYPVITLDSKYTHQGTKTSLIGLEKSFVSNSTSSGASLLSNIKDGESSNLTSVVALLSNKGIEKYNELIKHYSLENRVTKKTPPTFIVSCTDDKAVPVKNSIMYYNQLIDNDIPVEMHIYQKGGHGWGFSTEKFVGKGNDRFIYGRENLFANLATWLKSIK